MSKSCLTGLATWPRSWRWPNRANRACRSSFSGTAPAASFHAFTCSTHQAELAGFICESFAFQVPAPDFLLAAFKGLSHVAPHAHVYQLKNEVFSRDPRAVDVMNEDQLIAGEKQPVQTAAEIVRADERLKAEFPRITLPLLILHGTADKATKFAGQLFYEHAGSPDKTLKLYEGHFHDLLNDIDKELVISDIKAWIAARLPATRAVAQA